MHPRESEAEAWGRAGPVSLDGGNAWYTLEDGSLVFTTIDSDMRVMSRCLPGLKLSTNSLASSAIPRISSEFISRSQRRRSLP